MYIYMVNINVYTACRLDKQLKEMEQKHHIGSSWNPSDRIYLEMKSTFTKDRKRQVAEALWVASSGRQFLLQIKAKYAGNFHSS